VLLSGEFTPYTWNTLLCSYGSYGYFLAHPKYTRGYDLLNIFQALAGQDQGFRIFILRERPWVPATKILKNSFKED